MQKLVILVLVILLIAGLALSGKFTLNKKPAGLEVMSSPQAIVFIDGENVGTTPYENTNLKTGVYTLRLEPDNSTGTAYSPWETRLELRNEVRTIVSRSFGDSEANSSGYTLNLVKEPGTKTYLSVITDPESTSLTIDGVAHGFTPLTKIETKPGQHTLDLSSPGYKPESVSVGAAASYNLIVNYKLAIDELRLTPAPTAAPTPEASASAAPSSELVEDKPYVLIKETGTGWLRVRQEASGGSQELGKANVGEKLKYLGVTSETGWHKVEFEGLAGWVSAQYVDLVR